MSRWPTEQDKAWKWFWAAASTFVDEHDLRSLILHLSALPTGPGESDERLPAGSPVASAAVKRAERATP